MQLTLALLTKRAPLPFGRSLVVIITAILLTVYASTANGQWKFVVDNTDEEVRWFIDISRIYYDETRIWVWFLMDYKELQTGNSGSYHSMEALEAINCVTREESFFDYLYYTEREGRGQVIDSDSFGGAGPFTASPDSIAETLVTAACEEFARTYKPKAIKTASLRSPSIQANAEQY